MAPAARKTLGDYEKQVNMEFRDKVTPDGVAGAPWSDAYRERVDRQSGFAETLPNGVDRYHSGFVNEADYGHAGGRSGKRKHSGMRKTLADYVGFTGESASHTLLVLTGTMYASTLDMVHGAKVKDEGFELLPEDTSLQPYSMEQDEARPFLGMGDMVLDQALEYGLDEAIIQCMEAW